MREPLEVLYCDATGCEEQVVAGASRLTAQAREKGWQVKAVRGAAMAALSDRPSAGSDQRG